MINKLTRNTINKDNGLLNNKEDIKEKNKNINTLNKDNNINITKENKNINVVKENNKVIGTPLNNPFYEAFCLIYSKTLNKTSSYLQARKAIKGDSITDESACTSAIRLLEDESIRTRLAELFDHTANSLQINKTEILEGIQHELELDPATVLEWQGDALKIKSLESIPLHIRRTIKSMKQAKDGSIEVQFYDKQRAREQLMRFLGMLSDKLDINVTHDIGNTLAEAHTRYLRTARSGEVQAPEGIQDVEYTEIKPDGGNGTH
jgi:hypothetical protein